MQNTLSIGNIDAIVSQIIGSKKKLIYVAGASASGKSYIAQLIAKELEKEGKTVLTISSDNYYKDDTWLKAVLYGTFDHPDLIEYELLEKHIAQCMENKSFDMPSYNFKESKRDIAITLTGSFDYIIVEGLYTISKLSCKYEPMKIYVTAPEEDLVIRRLLRDPARVGEPLYMVVGALNNVYPMRNIFGRTQQHSADLVIDNYYDLLLKEGKKMYHEPFKGKISSLGKKVSEEYVVGYIYNDTTDDNNGKIILEEHYDKKGGIMKSVTIVKTRSTEVGTKETIEHISLSLSKAGILTQIHNLLQVAGLSYETTFAYDMDHYDDDGKKNVLEKRVQSGTYIRYES